MLLVLSGPSGVGKDMLLTLMKKQFPAFHFTVTMTTRPKRDKETDGVDYFFVSRQTFLEMVARDELLEWSEVYGNLYGVPFKQVREALDRGQDTVLKIDVQGARKVKQKIPSAVLVFVAPPSEEALAARLRGRKTENDSDFRVRLETSREEMKAISIFDYLTVNDEGKIQDTLESLKSIIATEKNRRLLPK
ncbi:MAG: guanylate kinase [Chloroflexi bacterium]|nr:guanylate kinase [Chloroflexota bacterium]